MSPVIPAITPPSSGPAWPVWVATLALLTLAATTIAAGTFATSEGRRLTSHVSRFTPHASHVTPDVAKKPGQKPMIKVVDLTKAFGDFRAVDRLSFEVAPGESVALWGPNGAGKTTVIRSLLGLYSARGELWVNGWDVRKDGKKARAAVGYVPQELAFYGDLSARQTLLFFADLKQVHAPRVEEVLAEVGLSNHGDKPVAALSGGMKQRLALAIALLADPPLLMLDEPTSNLDATARDDFIKLLLRQKAGGKTLLLTSHRLEEIELLATRVLVLEDGRLKLTCNRPSELADQLGMQIGLKLVVPEPMREGALRLLQAQGFAATSNGTGLHVTVLSSAKTAPLRALLAADIEIDDFELDHGILDENGEA